MFFKLFVVYLFDYLTLDILLNCGVMNKQTKVYVKL